MKRTWAFDCPKNEAMNNAKQCNVLMKKTDYRKGSYYEVGVPKLGLHNTGVWLVEPEGK